MPVSDIPVSTQPVPTKPGSISPPPIKSRFTVPMLTSISALCTLSIAIKPYWFPRDAASDLSVFGDTAVSFAALVSFVCTLAALYLSPGNVGRPTPEG